MTRLAQTERLALCETAVQVGPDAATLCGSWTVRDLLVHLLVREGSPAAVGIFVPPLAGLTRRRSGQLASRPFPRLVEQVRSGPPWWSPYALTPVDAVGNAVEMYVHHEDVRRAQPGWSPRALPDADESLLWSLLGPLSLALTRQVEVGVVIEDSRADRLRRAHRGTPSVTLRGLPSELALHLFGRRAQADVEVLGDPEAVRRLAESPLGL